MSGKGKTFEKTIGISQNLISHSLIHHRQIGNTHGDTPGQKIHKTAPDEERVGALIDLPNIEWDPLEFVLIPVGIGELRKKKPLSSGEILEFCNSAIIYFFSENYNSYKPVLTNLIKLTSPLTPWLCPSLRS
jgi:hypothetical protein